MVIHAKDDPSVKFSEAEFLHQWNPNAELVTISDSDHVFGARHPWEQEEMPMALKEVVENCTRLIKE